jgi:hypothetical protein
MTAARLSPLRAPQQVSVFRVTGAGSRPPRSRHIGHQASGPRFKPGDPVKETGIYEVVHDGGHREVHEAVMLADDSFPACDTCLEKVRFRLLRTAPYIFDDDDFEE